MTALKQIALPDLGEGVTQATLVEWLIAPGADFDKGDIIAEVMTDKVAMEVIAEEAGTLVAAHVADDTEVDAGTVLGEYRPAS